jgi:hypothetical protein
MSTADTTTEAFGVPDHFGRRPPRRAHTKEKTMNRHLGVRLLAKTAKALDGMRPI